DHPPRPAADQSLSAVRTGSPAGELRRLQRSERQCRSGNQQHIWPQLADTDLDSGPAHCPVRRPTELLNRVVNTTFERRARREILRHFFPAASAVSALNVICSQPLKGCATPHGSVFTA